MLASLETIIKRYGLTAHKALGQHYILDEHLLDKIARAAGSLEDVTVVEVGPGPGGLTRALLALNPKHLYSVEKDIRFLDPLAQLIKHFQTPFSLLNDDALKVDVMTLGEGPLKIIANLPYNVATPLILNWLMAQNDRLQGMALMVQKEVALRLTAKPRDTNYGRLSVVTQLLSHAEILFDVPPSAFTPPPKVDSAVVYFKPLPQKIDLNLLTQVEKITASAFAQRRKMLRSSLKSLGPSVFEATTNLAIDLTKRAEELSPQDYLNLAKILC